MQVPNNFFEFFLFVLLGKQDVFFDAAWNENLMGIAEVVKLAVHHEHARAKVSFPENCLHERLHSGARLAHQANFGSRQNHYIHPLQYFFESRVVLNHARVESVRFVMLVSVHEPFRVAWLRSIFQAY